MKEWGENYDVINYGYGNSAIKATFGDLKPFISKDYSWLYSTTYWNSTVFNDSMPSQHSTYRNTYFVFTAEHTAGFKPGKGGGALDYHHFFRHIQAPFVC